MKEISNEIMKNREKVQEEIKECADILIREVKEGFLVYPEAAVASQMLEMPGFEEKLLLQSELKQGILSDFEGAMAAMLAGNAVYFRENRTYAIKVESEGYPGLGIRKCESEKVMRGSQEAFSESAKVNIALIRKRIRSCQMKVKEEKVGRYSNTLLMSVWLEDIAYSPILKNLQKKLASFEIDGVMDSGIVEYLTEEQKKSPIPLYQTTERPDQAAQALLNGRIVLLTDDSPEALLLPATCGTQFQTSDDFYRHFLIVSFLRTIRYVAAFLAITLPGLYVAAVTFHPQLLPLSMIKAMAEAREGVPLSAAGEVLFMELSFELLREAGLRMPGPIGNTIGIVGGLIVGQSAVSANLVSPMTVIVAALTALGSFSIPNEEVSEATRLFKYGLLFLCSFWGIPGAVIGWILLFGHLSRQNSFGIPWLYPFVSGEINHGMDRKNGIFATANGSRKLRPVFAMRNNRRRLRFKKG